MKIIEERTHSQPDKKYFPILFVIPALAIGYAYINGKPTTPIIIGFCIYIVILWFQFWFLGVGKQGRLLLEIHGDQIYHAFNPSLKPGTVELSKVSLIRYGKDYIGFEGADHYAREIFFPRKYQDSLKSVVSIIQQQYPKLKIEEHT